MVAVSLKKDFFQAEDGIRDRSPSRGLGDVYKRQAPYSVSVAGEMLTLNAGKADGFRIGDRFLLFPGNEIFKSHGIASALESVAIAEIVRSNRQSALLHTVEGDVNLRSGVIMNAKSIRLML